MRRKGFLSLNQFVGWGAEFLLHTESYRMAALSRALSEDWQHHHQTALYEVRRDLQAPALYEARRETAEGSPRTLHEAAALEQLRVKDDGIASLAAAGTPRQPGLLDARGAAHRREIAAMQLYQARLEQQIQSLRQDKERVMALNEELERSAAAAGVVQSERIAELQRMVHMERDATTSECIDIASGMERAEMQAMKREIIRLELEAEHGKMHVKELLFSQKLERLQHAQLVEQKRRETDAKEEALSEIRSLKHQLQVDKVQISTLKVPKLD